MTSPLEGLLEPMAMKAAKASDMGINETAFLSAAMSLKRIADAQTTIASQLDGTASGMNIFDFISQWHNGRR